MKKADQKMAIKKMAMAKKMNKTDVLAGNAKGAGRNPEFGPQDKFSGKDMKKEKGERNDKSQMGKHMWEV